MLSIYNIILITKLVWSLTNQSINSAFQAQEPSQALGNKINPSSLSQVTPTNNLCCKSTMNTEYKDIIIYVQ